MDALLADLSEVLSHQVKLHEELLAVLQDESVSIGQVAPSKLLLLQSAKQQIAHKIAAIETRRIGIVHDIAGAWEIDSKELTLSQIIARVSEEVASILEECFTSLKRLVAEIRRLANKNGSLSMARLKSVEMSLRFVHDWQKAQQTYSDAGTLQSTPEKISRASI
ncbi:MAG: flagellar protein FlgN [SAR324 cluster bacterium]|nr:flagellar protein FlgN [SAR324 cluster bacterium]